MKPTVESTGIAHENTARLGQDVSTMAAGYPIRDSDDYHFYPILCEDSVAQNRSKEKGRLPYSVFLIVMTTDGFLDSPKIVRSVRLQNSCRGHPQTAANASSLLPSHLYLPMPATIGVSVGFRLRIIVQGILRLNRLEKNDPSPKKVSLVKITHIAVILTSFTLLIGCEETFQQDALSNTDGETTIETQSRIQVQTLLVAPCDWPTIARSQGSLIADEQTVVSTKVAGRVKSVNVDLGDYVNASHPLVLIDTTEFELRVNQAEARLNQARAAVGLDANQPTDGLRPDQAPPVRQEKAIWEEAKNSLQRSEKLLQQGAISRGEYDIALAAERSAEARHASALNAVQEKIAMINTAQTELSLTQHQIAEATITAPFSGYIRSRRVAPGSYLSVGEPVATLVRTDPLRFSGSLPERYAQLLRIGLTVRLQLSSQPRPITATISRVSPTLNDQNRTLSFEADLANPNQLIKAGLFVEAEVVVEPQAKAIAVPLSAVDSFAGVQKVWKVVDNHAVEQEVLLGSKREQWCEITSGIQAGDEILLIASKGQRAIVERTDLAVPTDQWKTKQQAQVEIKQTNSAVIDEPSPTP